MKIPHILTLFSLLYLALILPVCAESGEPDPGLLGDLGWGWSSQLRIVGFGVATEAANTARNPDNRIMILASYASSLQVRPDFQLEMERLSFSFQPRFEVSGDAWNCGPKDDREEWRDAAYVQQWLARLQFADTLYASYGRENLQWGPSYLTSLSNPFFNDNGKGNPKAEIATTDFARAVWVGSPAWSVSLIANTSPGRMETDDDDFAETYALKTDYTGSADYGSMVLTASADGREQIGGFFGSTVSEALLLYSEGVVQRNPAGRYPQQAAAPLGFTMAEKQRDDDTWIPSFLAGAAYTLESNPTLTLEYLYYGLGYSQDEADDFFNLQENAAAEIADGSADTPLAYRSLSLTADPGLRFLRRNYLMMQYVHPDIGDVINLTLRWTENLDDGSGRLTFIGDWFVDDHLQLFAVGTYGSGADRSEFGSIIDYQMILGVMYVF